MKLLKYILPIILLFASCKSNKNAPLHVKLDVLDKCVTSNDISIRLVACTGCLQAGHDMMLASVSCVACCVVVATLLQFKRRSRVLERTHAATLSS